MFPQVHHYGTDDVKIDEICRLCRSSKGVMSYIFSSVGVDTTVPVSMRITSIVNIRMHEGDGLPSLICHRCLYHVEQMNEFKTLCEQSDLLLRQYISYQVLLQMEDEEKKGKTKNSSKTTSAAQCRNTERSNCSLTDDERSIKLEENDSDADNAMELYQAMDQSDDQMSEDDDSDENYLVCATCNKRFTLQEALDRHSLIHTQDGPFPCDYCAAQMPDKALLRVHWRQVHAGNKSHMCQTCGESFYLKENLAKHSVRHDKLKPYRCVEPSCKKAFAYRSDLRKHAIIHSGIRPYVCPICFKAFTRSTNLNKHARVHNGSKPFPCGDCDKMFATRGDLMRHSLIHTGEKPYSCSVCFLSFNRKDKLTRHEKLHTEPQRAHVCFECPTSFNRKEDLTKHIQFHHYSTMFSEDNPIKEEKDDNSQLGSVNGNNEENDSEETATDLRVKHRREDDGSSETEAKVNRMHNGSKENRCRNSPGSPINLKIDMNDDSIGDGTEAVVISVDPSSWEGSDARANQCDVCSRSFKNREELLKHVALHGKSRDFVCEICFKGFHQRRELVRHSLTHSGFKPYSCETCGKAFSRRDKLTRHMRTHGLTRPGKNPSTCGVCLKSYSSRHNLSRHLLTHTNYKPYQCSTCTASYSRKDKLVKHIKSIHSIE